MANILWPYAVLQASGRLPQRDREILFQRVSTLERQPRKFPVRMTGRLRSHRWLLADNWILYYRVLGDTVYVRGLWPAWFR